MTAARSALVAVDGVEYAVDAAWVRRSLPAPEPLPATIAHGGASFRVIDLRQLFGLPAPAGPPLPGAPAPALAPVPPATLQRLILLVEQPAAEDDLGGAAARAALVVDDLLGIEPLAASAAAPLPAVYRGPERSWFRGLVPRAGGRVAVLLRPAGLVPRAAPSGPAAAEGGNGC